MERRDLLKAGAFAPLVSALSVAAAANRRPGIEGQRQPDLGNGRFLNPVLSAITRTLLC